MLIFSQESLGLDPAERMLLATMMVGGPKGEPALPADTVVLPDKVRAVFLGVG